MSNDDRELREIAQSLPPAVALSWGLIEQPKRGPKRELSIPQIVEAAIRIADQVGLSAVSMDRVARSLGFTAMSLYRYIPSKDDLLLLMQDAVCDIPIPDEKDDTHWRDDMREYVQACINVFVEHPWFGDIPITGIPLAPNNLRVVDWALRTMRHFPLNEYEKMSFLLLLSSYARGWGIVRRDMMRAIASGSGIGEFSGLNYTKAMKQLIKSEQYPYLAPIVASGTYTGENDTEYEMAHGNDFDFGLERLMDGIEHYINARESQT